MTKDSSHYKGFVMIRNSVIAAFCFLTIGQAVAQQSNEVTLYALKAMERGYGSTCSLEMIPVLRGGYYPCLDFGPYRIVKQYERVTGYVIQEGKQPFLVFRMEANEGGFIVKGPWEVDMPVKMAMFWNDVVEGRGAEAKVKSERENERRAAEAFIFEQTQKVPMAGSKVDTSQGNVSPSEQPPINRDTQQGAGGGIIEAISGTAILR